MLLAELETDYMARLRWTVFKRFGVMPFSRTAKRITDAEVLICAANMVLDGRGAPAGAAEEAECNSAFDEAAFLRAAEVEHES